MMNGRFDRSTAVDMAFLRAWGRPVRRAGSLQVTDDSSYN
jgi:hypothetical protein